jgi:hypothetical protein
MAVRLSSMTILSRVEQYWPTMAELKSEGKVPAIGLSTKYRRADGQFADTTLDRMAVDDEGSQYPGHSEPSGNHRSSVTQPAAADCAGSRVA